MGTSTGTYVDINELYDTGHITFDELTQAKRDMIEIDVLLEGVYTYNQGDKHQMLPRQVETYDDTITRLSVNVLNGFSTHTSMQAMISITSKKYNVDRIQVANDIDFKCENLSVLFEGEY